MRTAASLLIVGFLAGCTTPQAGPDHAKDREAQLVTRPKPGVRDHIVPGTTIANVPLQQLTLDEVKGSPLLTDQAVSCDPSALEVINTTSMSEPAPSAYSNKFRAWTELWMFDVCGDQVAVEVSYLWHITGQISLSVRPSDWSPL